MTSSSPGFQRDPEAKRFLNDRLDWNLLRTFLVIGQEGSISRAAARLHLSQPAISQALKRLEEQLASELVVRRGPRITLSKAGEEVMQIAAEIYGTVSRLGPALDAPAGLPHWANEAKNTLRPLGACSLAMSTAPPHSPPTEMPCSSRSNTRPTGAQMPA